jgi:hypothetical protein
MFVPLWLTAGLILLLATPYVALGVVFIALAVIVATVAVL